MLTAQERKGYLGFLNNLGFQGLSSVEQHNLQLVIWLSEQEVFLRKAAKQSLKNAEQYVKDAKMLLKMRSSGHAFALAVIGEEELAKASMYQYAAEGVAGVDGKWRKEISKYHTVKQRIAFGTALVYEMFLIAWDSADYAMKRAKGDTERFKELFDRKLADMLQEERKMASRAKGDLYEHLIPFGQMQRDRERAMYVEVDLKEQKISTPGDFKKSKTKKYILHVKERLDALEPDIGRKWTASQKENAILFLRSMLSHLSEEQKKEQLEWYGISEKDLEVKIEK